MMTKARTMRAAVLGACGALALCAAASAQTPAASPPDAERLALAQQIYSTMGGQALAATTKVLQGMMSNMTVGAGGQDTARTEAMKAALSDSFGKMMPRVLQGTVQLMAEDFTAEELRGMLAFYRSPTGQAVLEKMPVVMAQASRLSLAQTPQMMRDVEADYCGRVTCTEKERAAFAQVQARLAAQAAAAPAGR